MLLKNNEVMEKILKETEEKKIHVLYYKLGANMQALNKTMMQLRRLYGDRIIALPQDIAKLENNALSIQDLLNIRMTINMLIMDKLRAENDVLQPPDMRVGAVMPPNAGRVPQSQNVIPQMTPVAGPSNITVQPGNMRQEGVYQPQNGPQRPPAPPTSGSNATKPAARWFNQGINLPFTNDERN